MKTFYLAKTIAKLNVSKRLKIKGIIIGYVEYLLNGYKLLLILPTMLLDGFVKVLSAIWEWLDSACYSLPDVQLLNKKDKQELINALKERNKEETCRKLEESDLKNTFKKN